MWEADGLHDIDGLLKEMHETMVAERGIGLAANQIGRSLRIFIKKTENGYQEFINPLILSAEEEVAFEGEGCLSIPGAVATTKRFRKLRLQWQDRTGTTHEGSFEDMDAFAIQHEIDHLNGKLYVDQFGPLKRDMVVKKHKKFLKLSGRK